MARKIVFSRYSDKDGHGYTEEFKTIEEAIEKAKRNWNGLTRAEQKKFMNDPAAMFGAYFQIDLDDEWGSHDFDIIWTPTEEDIHE